MVSVEPEEVLADHVELNVKGIFMPRGDLYRMMSSIVGKTVYGSKTFQVPVRCGVVHAVPKRETRTRRHDIELENGIEDEIEVEIEKQNEK